MASSGVAHDIDLATIRQIVGSVQLVVARFYGPQCSQTLLTSQTGQAVITSDGLTILDSLQPSHPIAVLVTRAIRSCLRLTQDGCKVFLLYLSSILKNLESHISQGKFSHSGSNQTASKVLLNQQGALQVARCLTRLNQDGMPFVYDKLYSHSMNLYSNLSQTKSMADILKEVCKTTLAPHYNPQLCEYFSDMLHRFISAADIGLDVYKCLQFSLDHFSMLCIKVPTRSYSECTVLPTILIRRDFAVKCDQLLAESFVKVLMLNASIDGSENEEDPVSFNVKNKSSVLGVIHQRRHKAMDFVKKCAGKQVDLILSKEAVPVYILDMFRNNNISVIANVLKEDIDLFEQLTGKYAVGNQDEINGNNLIHALGVARFGLGGQVYINVKITPLEPVKHLIVSAPTIGLCDQAAMVLQKALNSMLMCLGYDSNNKPLIYEQSLKYQYMNEPPDTCINLDTSNSRGPNEEVLSTRLSEYCNTESKEKIETISDKPTLINGRTLPELLVIEGGGGFELLLSKLLANYCECCKDTNMSLVCGVLSDSLVNAIRVLYDCVALSGSKRDFLQVKLKLENKLGQGNIWGLGRRGQPCDVTEKGILEPLQSKVHVFSCVLRLIEQLLKTDKIISVQKLNAAD